MQRKVNKVGTSTLTVSLPSKWVKSLGLKQGDELEVEIDGEALIIGGKKASKKLSLETSLIGLENMLTRTLAAIYKAGFCNVTVSYSTTKELEMIHDTVDRSCHVFEVMDLSDKKVKIQTITNLEPEKFDIVFRKIGHAVIDMAKETLIALKNNDEEAMQAVILKDKIVDRHTDFCRRIINIGHSIPHARPAPIYVIVEQSEVLADLFKTACKDQLKHKINIGEDLFKLLEKNINLIQSFYDALYNFSVQHIKNLGSLEKEIRELITEITTKTRKDSMYVYYFTNMFETAFEMKSALLTARIETLDEKK